MRDYDPNDGYAGERCEVCDMIASFRPGGYHTALCTDNPMCRSRASYETPAVKHLICHPCWEMLPRTGFAHVMSEKDIAAGLLKVPFPPFADGRTPCPNALSVALIAMLALARQGTPA